jgi:hypothetical protein
MSEFAFVVKGIEDAIMARLTAEFGGAGQYAENAIRPYRGELSADELRQNRPAALSLSAADTPLFLVCYVDGKNVDTNPDPWFPGQGKIWQHYCTFAVLCLAPDARGEKTNQTPATQGIGAYQMVADALRVIGGQQFTTDVASGYSTDASGYAIGSTAINVTGTGELSDDDQIRFAGDPNAYTVESVDAGVLTIEFPGLAQALPSSVTVIDSVVTLNDNLMSPKRGRNPQLVRRGNELTAYCVYFETMFRWDIESSETETPIEEIVFGIDPQAIKPSDYAPGVYVTVEGS